jgi:hypothetical protein
LCRLSYGQAFFWLMYWPLDWWPVADSATIGVELELVVAGLDTPVAIADAGDGSGRLFVVEKRGRIVVVQDGQLVDIPFLDITNRVGSSQNEQGLPGLAFHPEYAANGLFFVKYTNREGDTTVSRFAVGSATGQADPGSETILLTLDQPAANHNWYQPNSEFYLDKSPRLAYTNIRWVDSLIRPFLLTLSDISCQTNSLFVSGRRLMTVKSLPAL